MSFLYPLGLLGLLAIPVIILIYILQSKYTEQTVPSNYLWHLSERFLKKRNPLSGLTGIISLILQLLTVVIISLSIARPIITLPNAAQDYCFILDASGSMNLREGRKTRFELAQEEIVDVIKKSKSGSSYTLITVSDEAVTVFDALTSKDSAVDLVRGTAAGHTHGTHAELLGAAQKAFDAAPTSLIYLATDKSYATHENVEILDVGSEDVANYALFDVTYSHTGGVLRASANAVSYAGDVEAEVCLSVDGTRVATETLSLQKDAVTPISFEHSCAYFDEFRIEIVNEDGYALDNGITTYNLKSDKTYSTLIVSETGFFFEAVLDALIDSDVRVVSPKQYESVKEPYGLYIFDCCEPAVLPDGAVWLINPDRSIADAGFGVRETVEYVNDVIEKSNSSATFVRHLLRGVDGSRIAVGNYVKYSGMYLKFHTLFSYDSNPLIFVGENGLGNRQVVFGFDLHESDFALSTDFVILARNLLEYSFPNVIEQTDYTVGDEALINLVANAENLKAISPSGKDLYIDTENGSSVALALDEVGTYVVSLTLAGQPTQFRLYSSAAREESLPVTEEPDFSLSGERVAANRDGKLDPLPLLLILLAVIFIADWGVYCYEKYQLR